MNDKYIMTDVPGLVKDPCSRAILNVDNAKLEAYRRQKRVMNMNQDMNSRMETLENEVSGIKNLLVEILGNLKNK